MAVLAEEAGFDSLLFPEHTHVPSSRETPYPGSPMPEGFERLHDPLVAAMAAACASETLTVGTAVCLVAQHDPISLAKRVASVDSLTGGRFFFGIGAGWNIEEMVNHGVDPKRRFRQIADYVKGMKEIWTQDEASYEGEFLSFEKIWAWPKPVSSPHPPVILGGLGKTVENRVLDYGDGWMPNVTRDGDEVLMQRIRDLKSRAEDVERDIRVVLNFAPRNPRRLENLISAGVDEVIYFVRGDSPEPVEERLAEITSGLELIGLR